MPESLSRDESGGYLPRIGHATGSASPLRRGARAGARFRCTLPPISPISCVPRAIPRRPRASRPNPHVGIAVGGGLPGHRGGLPPAPPGNPFTRADGTCPLIPPREGTDREALTKRDGTGDGLTVQRPKEIGRFFYNVAASRIGRQGPLHLSHLVTTRCSCRCPRCIWRDNRSEEMETRRSRTRTYRCAKREWLPTPTSCGQESHSRGRTSRPCAGHPEKPA